MKRRKRRVRSGGGGGGEGGGGEGERWGEGGGEPALCPPMAISTDGTVVGQVTIYCCRPSRSDTCRCSR